MWHDASHPIWRIGTILSITLLVIAVEVFNANEVNWDEFIKISQILGGIGAGAGLKSFLTKNPNTNDPSG